MISPATPIAPICGPNDRRREPGAAGGASTVMSLFYAGHRRRLRGLVTYAEPLSADSEWHQRKVELAAYVNSHHVWVVAIVRRSPCSSRHISGSAAAAQS